MSILISTPHRGDGQSMRQLLRAKCQSYQSHLHKLTRPILPIHQYLLLASAKRPKEGFPIFIKMSDQRYRSDRTQLLYKLIGQNFKTLRGYKQVSIRQVSDATKISIYKLRKLEAGTYQVRSSTLLVVCDYFGVSIDCMVRQDLSREQ